MCLRQVESESEMFSKWRERSRSGKRQLFKFWGKCPSKSADGRGERFMMKPHRLPAGAASTLRRDRLLAGSASTEEPAVMKSSTRRLIIDRLLAERGVVPFELFEEVLRVSAPTIKRDLRYMREELGAPIQFSKARGGYCYAESPDADEHKTVPALRAKRASQSRTFDPFRRTKDRTVKLRSKQWYSSDELFVLTSTYDLLGQLEADGSSALAKELSPLRARVMDLFNLGGTSPRMLMRHVRVIDRSVIFREPEAFELVGCALCEKRRLRISYHSQRTGETKEREISPLRLVHYRNRWYVDAYCHLTEALKTFLIENISNAEILTTAVRRIPLSTIEAELDSGYGIFHGRKIQSAELHFTQEAGSYVLREAWHPKQRVEKLDDGTLMLTVPYSDSTEIVGEILRWGSKVEVVGPQELREEVRDEAARIAAQYTGDQKGDDNGNRG